MRFVPIFFSIALLGCKDSGGDSAQDLWLVPETALGGDRATGRSMDLSVGSDIWGPLSQVIPFLEYDDPASDVPFFSWDLATSDRVADMGSCPDVQAIGRTTSWLTWGCRSTQGYEWSGEVNKEEWDDDTLGWRYARWDFDLDVVADVEDRRFDTMSLKGTVYYVIGDGEQLDHAVQINMRNRLDGYWERQNATDAREDLWSDWAVTARYEEAPANTYRMEGTAELGSAGAFSFSSRELTRADNCPSVPDGRLDLEGAQKASVTFNGSSSCSTCADLTVDGAAAGTTCRN